MKQAFERIEILDCEKGAVMYLNAVEEGYLKEAREIRWAMNEAGFALEMNILSQYAKKYYGAS